MFERLQTASLRLDALLADPSRFRVPLFQRPYAWTIREAGQLLDDLVSAAGLDEETMSEPDYFLGAVVLLELPSDANVADVSPAAARTLEIVDGQQRLVSLAILAAVLRDLESDPASETGRALDRLLVARDGGQEPRIELRGHDDDVLARHVLKRGATRTLLDDDDEVSLAGERMVQARDHYRSELAARPLDQRRRLAEYICTSCHFVVIVTRDIDRAHRMFCVLNERGLPLTRNDILKAELLRGVSREQRREAEHVWESACSGIEREFESFFSHLRTLYGSSGPQVIEGVRSIITTVGGPQAFLRDVFVPFARSFRLIVTADRADNPLPAEMRRLLVSLGRLSGQDWVPATMIAVERWGANPEWAHQTVVEIERLSYLLRICGIGSDRRSKRFALIVAALRNDKTSAGAVFTVQRDELRAALYNLKDLHVRSPQACKPVLLRLSEDLAGEPEHANPSDLSIEHVLPQRPSANSSWRQLFPDTEERKASTASLGNLVLVPARQNEYARNKDFARKCEIFAAGADTPLLAITRTAVAASVWTAEVIQAREEQLMGIIARIWRIEA